MNLRVGFFGLIAFVPFVAAEEKEKEQWDVNSPPGDSFEIPIEVTEGTWMSLDVSPDGRTIAFDMLGDIYTLPIEGGDATNIAPGMAWNMQPRFSPDGSEIAYTSDAGGGDNIWIMKTDGSDARQLTKEEFRLLNNASWSPEGEYIAARKHFTTSRSLGTGEIWIYHRNGGSGIAVVEKPSEQHQKELGEPAWSPDGRYIYFTVDSTPGSIFTYAQDSHAQIFEIRRHDLQTGETVSLVTGAGGAVRPEPSPDGKYLAFVRRIGADSALFIKNLESGAERAVFTRLDEDLQEVWGVHGLYPNMDWTPDSESIVFWAGGGIHRIDIISGSVEEIPFRVEDTRRMFDAPIPKVEVAPATFDTHMVRNAEVSPDGSKVVFESLGRLWIQSVPEGKPSRLTRDSGGNFEFDPSWSRDGRSIAFVSWNDQELGHIHSVRANGGRSKRLSNQPGHYLAPRFSPDGKNIAFDANAGGYLTSDEWSINTGIFLMPSSGGDAQRVSSSGSNPHFGASDDRVFFTRGSEQGGRELVSVDLDGQRPRTHATGPLVSRFEVSPDGRHLAFRDNYQVFALPLPPGGKAVAVGTAVAAVNAVRASGDGGNYPHWSDNGRMLNWSLGATLFGASVEDLFTPADPEVEDSGYKAPESGVSMSMNVDSDVPTSTLVLNGATVITMTDDEGGVIENAAVVVENNRITAIGDADTIELPDNADIVDVSGKTIIPGLIDAHAHGSQGVGFIPQQNWINLATLSHGVTTIFDPSNDATEIFAAAELQKAGIIVAPRMYSTGDIVYGAKAPGYFAEINSKEDAAHHIRRLKAQGAIAVKNYNQPRRNQRQQVTVAAREENMMVVGEGGSLFHMDLSMVADGNTAVEHNLPQEVLYDDVLQFWSGSEVHYTPTLVVTYGGLTAQHYWQQETNVWEHPILSNFVPPRYLNASTKRRTKAPLEDFHHISAAAGSKQLADAGVGVSIGAHGQREGLASHWEIWGFAQGGMSAVEALKAATIWPAEKIGMQQDIGTLEVGKLADLVVLDKNPLDDIYQSDKVNMVMLNGRLYDAKTMNENITGDRKTQPMFWQ